MSSEPTTETLLAGIRRWVEIESQTGDVDGVNRMMTQVATEFTEAGGIVERIAGRDGYGDHLSIRSPWGQGPGVLVLCHLDTVHPKGTLANDLPFRIDGDRAYGPGICDMKGGAYIALAAFRDLVQRGQKTPLPIRFLYTSDEEVGSPTSRALIETEAANARFVLVTEPAREGGKIVVARKGVGRFVMVAHGRPAHSGARHQDGRNAIRELAHQILHIEGLTDYERGVTFNIGQISGGTAENVVPARAEATIDMRVNDMADAEHFTAHVLGLQPVTPDVRLEISGGMNRMPYEQNDGVKRLFDHAKKLAEPLGIDLVGIKTGGGSDGNFTAQKAPTLDGLGVDGHAAHTLEEHIYISSLLPRMRLQQRLMETLGAE
jgi:glutamate carboxypeptidase